MPTLTTPRRIPRRRRAILVAGALSIAAAGCARTSPSDREWTLSSIDVAGAEVTGDLPSDAGVEAFVAPFRARMEARTDEVIGEATAPLVKQGEWESALGNFSADAMLYTVNRLVSPRVHVAITNNGGLRVPIRPGPITVGLIYELMPFEDMMVVQTLSGTQLLALADELVRVGGEPMAGLRVRVDDDGEAADVTLDGAPIDPAAEYRVVTSDYLANGSGNLPTLWDPVAREDLGVTLREAFMRYVRETGTIAPTLDGRIGWANR